MSYGYDDYLSERTELYMSECLPKVIGINREYESRGEYSTNPEYNCENCEEQNCRHWKEYNGCSELQESDKKNKVR